jgi:hypothetical protein
MIKSFDKQNLKSLRMDMESALLQVASKHGIVIQVGNASFYPEKGKFQVHIMTKGNTPGVGDDASAREVGMAADFKRYAKQFGLKPEQYGVTFKFGRETYKLVGLKPRAPKMPVLATNVSNGTTYKLPESAIHSLQSADYKKLYGITAPSTPFNGTVTCSNPNVFSFKEGKPTGPCKNPATTSRKGFGRDSKSMPYCDECAHLIDESRREMEAEARCS